MNSLLAMRFISETHRLDWFDGGSIHIWVNSCVLNEFPSLNSLLHIANIHEVVMYAIYLTIPVDGRKDARMYNKNEVYRGHLNEVWTVKIMIVAPWLTGSIGYRESKEIRMPGHKEIN